jgi:hypothetical protein
MLQCLLQVIYFSLDGNYARFMAARLPISSQFGIMNTSILLDVSTYFTFWYFMHGTQIGTLALVVNDQIVWQKSGRQGFPAWYQANVTMPAREDLKVWIYAK